MTKLRAGPKVQPVGEKLMFETLSWEESYDALILEKRLVLRRHRVAMAARLKRED